MDQLFSMGKKIFKNKMSGGGGGSSGGGGDSGFSVLKQFDRDGDGKITENDFIIAVNQMGLGSIGEGGARMVFRKLDSNHNGKLDFHEAIGAFSMIQNMLSSKQH